MDRMPLEMLEVVLMRTFVITFARHYKQTINRAGEMTYSTLAAVCYNWWQTLNGWPQSDTRHWFKHELKRNINRKFKREPSAR